LQEERACNLKKRTKYVHYQLRKGATSFGLADELGRNAGEPKYSTPAASVAPEEILLLQRNWQFFMGP
jgi:hypothetical protein